MFLCDEASSTPHACPLTSFDSQPPAGHILFYLQLKSFDYSSLSNGCHRQSTADLHAAVYVLAQPFEHFK